MKTPTTSVQTVSTVSGTAEVMGIDAAGMGTVLSILSNMYSDGSLAVVREYSSNALDSHVEAGNPDPILITSPSHFNPVLTVQDFGTGLSRDEVLNVYAKYGASTKRNTDEQIGAFGIGAKSAFTVGTQFTVTAVKDGFETIALFALNENGAPTVNIISYREDILEPNGVKVEVGVKDVDGVNRAIKRLFSTWKTGTVLVDGVEPVSVWNDLSPLADDIHLGWRVDKYNEQDPAWVVVMGGVPYNIPRAVNGTLSGRPYQISQQVSSSYAKVYFTVPIGAVDITPSREELRVTTKTTDTINELITRFAGLIGPWVSEQISGAGSYIEALVQYRKMQDRLGRITQDVTSHVTWNGKPMSGKGLDIPDVEWFELRNKRGNYYGDKVATRYKEFKVHPSNALERILFVTDVPERRIRSVQLAAKPYLKAEAQKDGKTGFVKVVALTKPVTSYTQDWFDLADPALVKTDFDSFIKQWKPAPAPYQRGETRYEIKNGLAEPYMTAAELKDEDEVLYLTDKEWKSISSHRSLLVTGSIPLVVLKPTQKVEVLVKKVPQAKSAHVRMEAYAEELLNGIGQNDIDAVAASSFRLGVGDNIINFLESRKSKITNQTVLKVLGQNRRAKQLQDEASTIRIHQLRIAARFLSRTLDLTGKSELTLKDWEKMISGLPLLTTYFERDWLRTSLGNDHVIDYINSVNL